MADSDPQTRCALTPNLGAEAQLVQTILDSTGEAVLLADERGGLVYASAAASAILGAFSKDAEGDALSWLDRLDLRLADGQTPCPAAEQPLALALRGQTVEGIELVLRRASNGVVWLRATARPLFDAAGRLRGAVVAFRDVTERKRLQEQYLQAQKMEALGRLASGVAHDFNNLLTVISGYGELIQAQLAPGDPLRELLAEVCKASERGSALTRQLLAFSRKRAAQPQLLDLNALVRDAAAMLDRLLGESIRLHTRLDPASGSVQADPGQIEQVLLNLAVNARDAMPQGGRLTLSTDAVTLGDTATSHRPGLRPGPYVLLSVSDTGTGISDEVRARLFEPFFTTKGPGKGTGLGLATVADIVRQCGGLIEVESTPGHGATFTLYLPCCAAAPAAAEPAPLPQPASGNETILLVEDDEAVRSLCARVLQGHGYRVLEAADGPEALAACVAYRGPIHLLVADLVLPRLGGRELASRLRARQRTLQVLFLSGYPESASASAGSSAAEALLAKPFPAVVLAARVRSLLDGGSAGTP
jgi:two-component system cell cycle sensor histidine kinase/response regulator CckA